MMYFFAVVGLGTLILGGELLLRGAVGLARRMDISPLVVGLTILAFGTSAPELLVGVNAALDNAPGITVGNILGSNIANVWLVLGLPALLYPITGRPVGLKRNTVVLILATAVFMASMWDGLTQRWEGIIFLVAMATYLLSTYRLAQKDKALADEINDEVSETAKTSYPVGIAQVIAGCIALALGAEWLVDGATDMARAIGVSEVVIGVTMVALGTSLPELITLVTAALRRQTDLALGGVIGSNIFNILLIMGMTSVIVPVPVTAEVIERDMWIMLFASLCILPFVWIKLPMGRGTGLVFIMLYLSFISGQFFIM